LADDVARPVVCGLEDQYRRDEIIPCRARYVETKQHCLRPARWMVRARCKTCGTRNLPTCDPHAAGGNAALLFRWWTIKPVICMKDGTALVYLAMWRL
jgi:hypothetical protein